MTDEDLASLRRQLSPETQKRLEAQSPAKQWELMANWIRQGMRTRRRAGACAVRCRWPTTNAWPSSSRRLTDDERDQLLGLPGEEMQRRLQQMYLMRTRPLEGPERRPGGPNHGRWPGGGQPVPNNPDSTPPPAKPKQTVSHFVGVAVALPPLGAAVQLPHQRIRRSNEDAVAFLPATSPRLPIVVVESRRRRPVVQPMARVSLPWQLFYGGVNRCTCGN